MLLALNAYLVITGLFDAYNVSARSRLDVDWQRLHEQLQIQNTVNITASAVLNLPVTNVGAVPAHLVVIWITNQTADSHFQVNINYRINPGATVNVNKTASGGLIFLTVNQDYSISIITELGNRYAVPPFHATTVPYTPPIVPYSYGSMKIKYTGTFISASDASHPESRDTSYGGGWVFPWTTTTILSLVCAQQPSTSLYVKAAFKNSSGQSITILQGNLLFQVSASTASNKVYFLGGILIYNSAWGNTPGKVVGGSTWHPVTYNQGDQIILIWQIQKCGVSIDTGDVPLVFTGSVSMSSASGQTTYFSAFVNMDGLLIPS